MSTRFPYLTCICLLKQFSLSLVAIQRIDSLIKEVMEQEKFKMGVPPPMIPMQTSLPGMVSFLFSNTVTSSLSL